MKARQRACKVVDRRQEQVLARAGGRLDRGRTERRLPARREDDAVDAAGLGAPEQGAQVLGVLEGVEREDERRLGAPDRAGQDLVRGREMASLHDERDTLVAIEPGGGGQGAPLDLDDRDPEGGRVEHEPFERIATLRRHEEATRRPAGDERLLHRTPTGDQLLVIRQDEGRARLPSGPPGMGALAGRAERPGGSPRWPDPGLLTWTRWAIPEFAAAIDRPDLGIGRRPWPGDRSDARATQLARADAWAAQLARAAHLAGAAKLTRADRTALVRRLAAAGWAPGVQSVPASGQASTGEAPPAPRLESRAPRL